jgi:hypothetical protein
MSIIKTLIYSSDLPCFFFDNQSFSVNIKSATPLLVGRCVKLSVNEIRSSPSPKMKLQFAGMFVTVSGMFSFVIPASERFRLQKCYLKLAVECFKSWAVQFPVHPLFELVADVAFFSLISIKSSIV